MNSDHRAEYDRHDDHTDSAKIAGSNVTPEKSMRKVGADVLAQGFRLLERAALDRRDAT
jgi:hypothetical protein